MELFGRRTRGAKKWRTKAMLVDFHKTKITLSPSRKPKRVPPWMYEELKRISDVGSQPDSHDT